MQRMEPSDFLLQVLWQRRIRPLAVNEEGVVTAARHFTCGQKCVHWRFLKERHIRMPTLTEGEWVTWLTHQPRHALWHHLCFLFPISACPHTVLLLVRLYHRVQH